MSCRLASRGRRCPAATARPASRCASPPRARRSCISSTSDAWRSNGACHSTPHRCQSLVTTGQSTGRQNRLRDLSKGGIGMEFGLQPGTIFAVAIALFLLLHFVLRAPLPLSFIVVATVSAFLGDFGIPFRHLVEGGFGFINLVLALFAGAFFGHMMRRSGAADAAAAGIVHAAAGRVLPILAVVGLPLFVVGMFVGIAGVAVLSAGVFVVPALRRIGYDEPTIAAFIAIMATAGMIAPPMNVPALLIADGVNMPWTNVAKPLLALSLPLAATALAWFAWCAPSPSPRVGEGWGGRSRGCSPIVSNGTTPVPEIGRAHV